jgi:hypothetical protein
VRQAHPGPRAETYESYGQKMDSARQYVQEEDIPWPVLVDELSGRVHEMYGTMTDPTYLIGSDGRVVFYCMWTRVPVVRTALEALLKRGGSGVVMGGVNRIPHLGAAFVGGWPGVKRGGVRAIAEYELAAPGSATVTFLGYLARPLLAPIALRSRPVPRSVKLGLVSGLAAAAAAGVGAALLKNRKR